MQPGYRLRHGAELVDEDPKLMRMLELLKRGILANPEKLNLSIASLMRRMAELSDGVEVDFDARYRLMTSTRKSTSIAGLDADIEALKWLSREPSRLGGPNFTPQSGLNSFSSVRRPASC